MSEPLIPCFRDSARQVLADKRLWLVAACLAAGLVLACLSGGGESGGGDAQELGGASPNARAQAMKASDPVLYAITQGTLPKLNDRLTLEEAFARYPWFDSQAVWMSRGGQGQGVVLVTVRLKAPAPQARLGLGTDQAALLFVCEFGLSGDAKSFRPLRSAIEMRDASNRLVSRMDDREFVTLRRIMAGREPAANLIPGAAGPR